MGICFIGEVPMRDFLQKEIKSRPGKIVTTDGQLVGRHQGLSFYTIGERHLGTAGGREALFLVAKRVEDNALLVGPKNDPGLYKKCARLTRVHWIRGQVPAFPLQCKVRLRHRAPLEKATIRQREKKIEISFSRAQWGVTPGQFAVIYSGEICLGGGAVA